MQGGRGAGRGAKAAWWGEVEGKRLPGKRWGGGQTAALVMVLNLGRGWSPSHSNCLPPPPNSKMEFSPPPHVKWGTWGNLS